MLIDGEEYITRKEATTLIGKKSLTSFNKFLRQNRDSITAINPTDPGRSGPGMKLFFKKSEIEAAFKRSAIVI